MKISRFGAKRDCGTTVLIDDLSLNSTAFGQSHKNGEKWDEKTQQLVITRYKVPHTDGNTHHNYTIGLTLDDISSLIGLLGDVGSAGDANLLQGHLAKHAKAILKMLACANGVATVPINGASK
jgi:hypothetical protein